VHKLVRGSSGRGSRPERGKVIHYLGVYKKGTREKERTKEEQKDLQGEGGK